MDESQEYEEGNEYAEDADAVPEEENQDEEQEVPEDEGEQEGSGLPPSGPQHFGPGAPEDYTFQYSSCTGKRKALLIGINYFGQDGELKGCINDVTNVSEFIVERYGYSHEDMVILTDDLEDPELQPTAANIVRWIEWLVDGAEPDDALFFHYSGHGGKVEDQGGDEQDETDETICPVDYLESSPILDELLHQMLVKPLQAGVRLTAIFDSCHSGSVLDLPYLYSTNGLIREPNLAAEAEEGLLSGEETEEATEQTKTSSADVIMFSGSRDDQTSADAVIANEATGAMSHAFIAVMNQNPQPSYAELLESVREILETGYSQKPQLSCSHPLDTDLLFTM